MHRTSQVANILGVKPGTINRAIFEGRLLPPPKFGAVYAWRDEDVHRASWVFRGRGADDILDKFAQSGTPAAPTGTGSGARGPCAGACDHPASRLRQR